MVNAEFSRIYRFVKLLVNEGFLAVAGERLFDSLANGWALPRAIKKPTSASSSEVTRPFLVFLFVRNLRTTSSIFWWRAGTGSRARFNGLS